MTRVEQRELELEKARLLIAFNELKWAVKEGFNIISAATSYVEQHKIIDEFEDKLDTKDDTP